MLAKLRGLADDVLRALGLAPVLGAIVLAAMAAGWGLVQGLPASAALVMLIAVGAQVLNVAAALKYLIERPARKRRAQIQQLNAWMNSGYHLRDQIRRQPSLLIAVALPSVSEQAREWEMEVYADLQRELPEFAGRFRSDKTDKVEVFQPNASFEAATWGNFMDRRLDTLVKIVDELSKKVNG